MNINKIIEELIKMNEEQEWKDKLGTPLHIGDTVLIYSKDKYEVYFFKGKIIGEATTPAKKEAGYVQVQLDSRVATYLPKNLIKYYN